MKKNNIVSASSNEAVNGDQDVGTPHEQVNVGDHVVPLEILQKIYEEITEKPQNMSRPFHNPIQVTVSDLEQLHLRFTQTCRPYNVKSSNCSFTILHVDDTKETFGSFAEFLKLNAGSQSATESVVMKYNLLIIEPVSDRTQSYTVTIRIVSQLASRRRFERDFSNLLSGFQRLMVAKTVDVEVECVDYVIARAFMGLVEEWNKSLPVAFEPKWIKRVQSQSHWLPRTVKLGTAIFVTWLAVSLLPKYMATHPQDFVSFGEFIAYSALGVFVAYRVAGWFAHVSESAIDRWLPLSYIQLNNGDRLLIDAYKKDVWKTLGKCVGGVAGSVVVELICRFITEHLL